MYLSLLCILNDDAIDLGPPNSIRRSPSSNPESLMPSDKYCLPADICQSSCRSLRPTVPWRLCVSEIWPGHDTSGNAPVNTVWGAHAGAASTLQRTYIGGSDTFLVGSAMNASHCGNTAGNSPLRHRLSRNSTHSAFRLNDASGLVGLGGTTDGIRSPLMVYLGQSDTSQRGNARQHGSANPSPNPCRSRLRRHKGRRLGKHPRVHLALPLTLSGHRLRLVGSN